VPDSSDWTGSIELMVDFQSGDQDYSRDEPDIAWSYEGDSFGYTRVRGFCQFPLDSVLIPFDRVRGCTLSYYIDDMMVPAPADIRHVGLDIPSSFESMLYADGGANAIVATDSGSALGWHHVAISDSGVKLLKENMRLNYGRIGYCWDVQGTLERDATVLGHDDSLCPYLTIIYADTAR
jgi:hypothetical protein